MNTLNQPIHSHLNLSMAIENCTVCNLYGIHKVTTREEIGYNILIIPKPFNPRLKKIFDLERTKAFFKLRYVLAFHSYPWNKASPKSNNK